MSIDTEMKALYVIANAGYSDDIMDIFRAAGASGGTIVHARGEGSHHHSFLGITLDHEQEIIICVTSRVVAEQIMADIKEKAGITTAVHAICYTMPVEHVIGLREADS